MRTRLFAALTVLLSFKVLANWDVATAEKEKQRKYLCGIMSKEVTLPNGKKAIQVQYSRILKECSDGKAKDRIECFEKVSECVTDEMLKARTDICQKEDGLGDRFNCLRNVYGDFAREQENPKSQTKDFTGGVGQPEGK